MKMTIEEKFREQVKDGITVVFRFADGKKLQQSFQTE